MNIPLPPWSEVWSVLRHLIAPALAASLSLMFLVRGLGGQRLASFAAALAIAGAVCAGNYYREAISWRIDGERALTIGDMGTVLGWSLESKPAPAEDGPAIPSLPLVPSRYWLPWLAGLAMVIELLVRLPRVPPGVAWMTRTVAALFAGRLLTPGDLRSDLPWSSWAFGAIILTEWAVLAALTCRWKDGVIPTAVLLTFGAGAVVILYAHSGRLMDMALMASVAFTGPALVACFLPGDTGAAMPAAAIVLPGLMFSAQQETFSEVPLRSFLLVGLAPLALMPLLLPFLGRQKGWRHWLPALVLVLAPATLALILAVQKESLAF
jgi:hypothetical protein